jgi:hypothetical protein
MAGQVPSAEDSFRRETGGFETAGDTTLDQFQISPTQAGNSRGLTEMRGGRRRQLPQF